MPPMTLGGHRRPVRRHRMATLSSRIDVAIPSAAVGGDGGAVLF
jgi:hypothetical protein